MNIQYLALFLDEVKNFIETLPNGDQGKINANVDAVKTGNFESVYIKTLRTPIKELIVNKYRLIFFIHENTIYFIRAFIKKTAKTPKQEIENAMKIYKIVIENYKSKK